MQLSYANITAPSAGRVGRKNVEVGNRIAAGTPLNIASLATLLTNREQFHSNRLGDAVSLFDSETQQRIDQMTQYFVSRGADLSTAPNQAMSTTGYAYASIQILSVGKHL